jgi:protein-tyrosine phosphatase
MIDIHLHILPGIDDGPETIKEALALARALVHEGVHTAIATPHYNDLFPKRSAAEVKARVNELQQALDSQNVPLRLLAGHEALIKLGLVEDIQTGRLATLNESRYLLLELWNNTWLSETEQVIFELRAFGIGPIIAPPERYHAIQQDADRLAHILQLRVLTQLTASSLVGTRGRTTKRCAESLLRKGLINYIASDAYGLQNRPPSVIDDLHYATMLDGQAYIKSLIEYYLAVIACDEKIFSNHKGF